MTTLAVADPPNVALAPPAGAVNVTVTPLSKLPPLSFTVACSAVANAVLTVALCGVPALTLPMGFGKQGLPLGLSFTGNLFAENTILQLGMLFQRETDWHLKYPKTI